MQVYRGHRSQCSTTVALVAVVVDRRRLKTAVPVDRMGRLLGVLQVWLLAHKRVAAVAVPMRTA